MVIVILLSIAAVLSMSFSIMYSAFFPWWKSRLGKALMLSKTSMSFVLLLAVLHLLNIDIASPFATALLVIAASGLSAANLGMLVELYVSWKESGKNGS